MTAAARPAKPAAGAGRAPAMADLAGLGPKSQAMLERAGIRSVAHLRQLGAVRAYAQVRASGAAASLNLLWALEGALTGLPWQVVAREHRLSLLLALEALTLPPPQPGRTARTAPADGRVRRPLRRPD